MDRELKLLSIEDSLADFLLLERHLRREKLHARCHHVANAEQLAVALEQPDWDVVLSDFDVPGLDFKEGMARIHQRLPDLPIILLAGSISETQAGPLLRDGVSDLVLKDNLTRLVPAIQHSVRHRAEQRGRQTAEQRLSRLVQVVSRIAAVRDLPALTAIACRAARDLTGADGASFVLYEDERCIYLDEDAIAPLWKGHSFIAASCIAGWAMRHGQAVALEDIYADARIHAGHYRPTFVKSLSMVPVGRETALAAIGCYWARPHHSSADELSLQQALADACAVGMANLDLFRRLETARTQAEQAQFELAESQQMFRNLAEIASDYFWALDEHFCFTDISSSISSHSKLDYQSYIGKTRWEIPTVGVDETSWAAHRAAMEAHAPFRNFELGLVNRDNELRWFVISGDPVFDTAGQFKGYRGVTRDVTDQRKSQEKLRQQAAVFSSVQEGIVITDLDGRALTVNPAFSRITEYTEQEIVGQNPRILQSGRHDQDFYRNMWQSILGTGSWQGEVWNRRKGGEIYPEWLTISTVYDSEGLPRNYIGIQVDISRMSRVETKLERLAQYDALTNLPNRMLLDARLTHTIARARRDRSMGAVLFIDLDKFKPVNDQLGHAAGDELLQAVAQRLGERLREVDTLARLGGDEFVVVLDSINDANDAAKVANELLDALRRPFVLSGERAVQIGASIGLALFLQDGDAPEQLLEHADKALYLAKGSGRGTFNFFDR